MAVTLPDASPRQQVLGWLDAVADAVAAEARRLRALDPDADAAMRGMYVSDGFAQALLARRPGAVADVVDPAPDERLAMLAERFALDDADLRLLVVAAAPDIDERLSPLYGYCQDDVSLRRAGAGFALRLAGLDPLSAEDRARLGPLSRLVDDRLVDVDTDGVWPRRQVRVADRVLDFLLGDDAVSLALQPLLVTPVRVESPLVAKLCAALHSGERLVHLRDAVNGIGPAIAATACSDVGIATISVDLTFLADGDDIDDLVADAVREAHLQRAGLVLGPLETIITRSRSSLRRLERAGWPVILYGDSPWDPTLLTSPPVTFQCPPTSREERLSVWRQVVADPPGDLEESVGHLRLSPGQVVRAARLATATAAADGRPLGSADLEAAGRAQNGMALETLTRRVEPRVGWDALVLPEQPLAQLRSLVRRVRDRDKVAALRVGGGGSSRRGTIAVFAGPSGTGKTLSSEVVAHDLGITLYGVNLATVVDKYIGETEKNLDRIFTQAAGVNGLLFFDEADALFGKRSEVKDARDRYANVEVAYLLQRLEDFDGVAVLSTNLSANLDEAFLRRIDVLVSFPEPDQTARRALWDQLLGGAIARADDVDLDFCARRFKLSGGDIRNIVVAAAFLAIGEDRPVTMVDLMRATYEEYRKLGRLASADEFGEWFDLARS